MSTRSLRLVSASFMIAALAAGCGDDEDGAGGAGGGGTTSSTGTTTTTTTGNTTTSTGGEGGGGEGGSGDGGAGGSGGAAEGGGGSGGASCVGELPDAYDGADFAENAAVELALRTQLGALNSAMAAAETDPENDLVVTAASLVALYEAGDPSLSDGMTAYYDGVVRDVFVDFEAASGAGPWTPLLVPVPPGGKFGSNIFDETGRDLRQWVEKGHFNAFFYPHAVALVDGGLDAAGIDRLLAAYGAHPDFPGDSSADTAENPDRLVAQYAERRSPKNTEDPSQPLDPADPGVYFTIKGDFILLQAAVANGCDEDRDAAAERILSAWERAMAGTVVYYLNDATAKLTSDTSGEAELASGLHGVGEATSFLHGFLQSPDDHRTITDAELEGLLELLADPYRFVVDSVETADLLAVREGLADVYGFSDAELEAFETNH